MTEPVQVYEGDGIKPFVLYSTTSTPYTIRWTVASMERRPCTKGQNREEVVFRQPIASETMSAIQLYAKVIKEQLVQPVADITITIQTTQLVTVEDIGEKRILDIKFGKSIGWVEVTWEDVE